MAYEDNETRNDNGNIYNGTTKPKKPKRCDKSDLGDNFIAPDGGWAWLVCVAAGFSNLTIFPMVQQFGLIFREKVDLIGLSSSQITTIINTQAAVSACTGLLNGPLFRRFTFRQVALAASCLIFIGISCTAFAHTFATFIMFFSIIFGFGMGISISSSSLAVNTYFKVKRRKAMGFSWTITGFGPIILPHLVTLSVAYYGVQGTVLIFAAIALNSFMCGLIYQPVLWHVQPLTASKQNLEPDHVCKFCELSKQRSVGVFSSQYLYKDDDQERPGFEITDPGTPMLARANDGCFGSKISLASIKQTARLRTISSSKDIEAGRKLAEVVSQEELRSEPFHKPNHFNLEREGFKKSWSKYSLRLDNSMQCTCDEERALLKRKKIETKELEQVLLEEASKNMSFCEKVVSFFDLGLLKDLTFVNLLVGLTIINFGEMNFAVLAPFVFSDYGLSSKEISTVLSLLASMDMTMRFLGPFLTEKIKLGNRVLYSIGIFGLVIGRTVIACTKSYPIILGACVFTGLSKGIRTIFWPLLIPSHVPLKRLPAASGLALLISGIFTLSCGPFVGLIRDKYDYSGTLHFLNILTFAALVMWASEALFHIYRRKCIQNQCVQN